MVVLEVNELWRQWRYKGFVIERDVGKRIGFNCFKEKNERELAYQVTRPRHIFP